MVTTYSVSSNRIGRNLISRCRLASIALLVCVALVSVCSGQTTVSTGRGDNKRTGANLNEVLLTPYNVNSNQFGTLFHYSIDYQALAQPLYVPNVAIPGQGTHNVVYVATMADSVYAFDADSNAGSNASPLWWMNFTDPANGITTASGKEYLPCSGGKTTGFTQEGIAGTPAIDTTTNTIYLVAKTLENGTVVHRLHALDITTGQEKFGGPIQIAATTTSNKGTVSTFTSLHELNRPGLLLMNGVVYIGFGSNGCDDGNASGWVLSYNAGSLSQLAVFNASPDHGLASIWQTGNGISADDLNDIFVETAETCAACFDVNVGGQTYSNSVVELSPELTVEDYFTPYDVQLLNKNDEDLSCTGVLVLPDQDGATPHEIVAGGKEGFVYLLNRDFLGGYDLGTCGNPPSCDDALQEFAVIPGEQPGQIKDVLYSTPAYWNNTVYFAPNASPLLAYPLSGGLLGTPLATPQKYVGAHSPSISANGNTNGILWVISGNNLDAFNATSLQLIYSSKQVLSRDRLPAVAHFATQTVVNGKVYVATQTTLSVYGLYQSLNLTAGGSQSAQVLETLPNPIQVQVTDPYSGVGLAGVTVNFSDGGKKGTFNPASGVSDANGYVSTYYTFPKKAGTYVITATSAMAAALTFAETALPGPAKYIVIHAGNKQTSQAGSILPNPLVVQIQDAYSNGVPGVTATFVDKSGAGTLMPNSAVSNASGLAKVGYQLPNKAGTYKVIASAPGLAKVAQFVETATGDAPQNLGVVSGNNQTGTVNTALPQPLVVQVADQGGTPIAGVSVVFSAPSGTLTGTPATTDSNGQASVQYTTGVSPGAVTITAAVNALTSQFGVMVTAPPPASVTPSGGNNQAGAAGTALPQALTVLVADQYGNPVAGVLVNFSDGGAGGSFSYTNPVTTNNAGTASQFYTLPRAAGTVTITASVNGVNSPAVFTENSVPGTPANVIVASGNNQSGAAGTQLPQALTALVTDLFGNPVPGVSVYFDDGGAGGSFSNANPVVTNATGTASQFYTFSPFLGAVTITASATGVNNSAVFTENSVAGPAAYVYITGGNNQFDPAGTQLPQALTVFVTDQYGNPVSGVNVGFDDGGAGGSFSNSNPVVTDNTGTASQMYTLPMNPGTVYINATANGVANPAVFTETGQ